MKIQLQLMIDDRAIRLINRPDYLLGSAGSRIRTSITVFNEPQYNGVLRLVKGGFLGNWSPRRFFFTGWVLKDGELFRIDGLRAFSKDHRGRWKMTPFGKLADSAIAVEMPQ